MSPYDSHLFACIAGAIVGGLTIYSYTSASTTDLPTAIPSPSPPAQPPSASTSPPTTTPAVKIPVTNRQAWKNVFGARLIVAWAAAIVIEDDVSADLLATIGRQEFGEERWAIEVHRFRDELM